MVAVFICRWCFFRVQWGVISGQWLYYCGALERGKIMFCNWGRGLSWGFGDYVLFYNVCVACFCFFQSSSFQVMCSHVSQLYARREDAVGSWAHVYALLLSGYHVFKRCFVFTFGAFVWCSGQGYFCWRGYPVPGAYYLLPFNC